MKTQNLILFLFLFCGILNAQKQILLYDGKAPGSETWTYSEGEMYSDLFKTDIVYNVVDPSVLVYKPQPGVADRGVSVLIAPGGGFFSLSINREGTDLAKKLAELGYTAFVLKYRLVKCKTNDPAREMVAELKDRPTFNKKYSPLMRMTGVDAKTAIKYIRNHRNEYGKASDNVGVIGFSAGGTVVLESMISTSSDSLPDFAACIYGAPREELLESKLPDKVIPMFVCAATDDQSKLTPKSIFLYNKWYDADWPIELHIYSKGGHGFGMGKKGLPVDTWSDRFIEWIDELYHN